jgi:hypothetical protein
MPGPTAGDVAQSARKAKWTSGERDDRLSAEGPHRRRQAIRAGTIATLPHEISSYQNAASRRRNKNGKLLYDENQLRD